MSIEKSIEGKEPREENFEEIKEGIFSSSAEERKKALAQLREFQEQTLLTLPKEKMAEEMPVLEERKEEKLFVDLHQRKVEILAQKYSLESPGEDIVSTLTLKKGFSFEDLARSAIEGGYNGLNFSLSFKSKKEFKESSFEEKIEEVKKKREIADKFSVPILSIHADRKYVTSPDFIVSKEVREKQKRSIINDFKLSKVVDLKENVPINFDLFLAPKEIVREKLYEPSITLKEIISLRKQELEKIGVTSDKESIKEIIKLVGESMPEDNKRSIYFELPGLMWYGGPKITKENMQTIVESAKKYISDDPKRWGITVDICHILGSVPFEKGIEGLKKFKKETRGMLEILKEFKDHIKELHISGPSSPYTIAAEKLAVREKRDIKLVKDLETHSIIDNKLTLEVVKEIRNMCKDHLLVEMSEVDPLAQANHVKKFGIRFDEYKKFLDKLYLDEIKSQGKMLGYTKE